MSAIEFHAEIKDGIIQVPTEYHAQFSDTVRVILMRDTEVPLSENLLEQLLAHPIAVAGFHPMTRDETYAK